MPTTRPSNARVFELTVAHELSLDGRLESLAQAHEVERVGRAEVLVVPLRVVPLLQLANLRVVVVAGLQTTHAREHTKRNESAASR